MARAPLRLVQVGAGLWGRSWAELVLRAPGFELVGVADSHRDARQWARSTLGVATFPKLGRALVETAPDVVLLISPPVTHRALAEEALAAGAHVVVEKPLALDLPDAWAIVDAAAAHGRHAVVAQNYRFRRQARALAALVREHAVGDLRGVRISFAFDLRRAWITSRDWRGQMRHPFLLDMAIHHIDLLRHVTGREVALVDARSWPAPDGPFRYEPTVMALLELDGGVAVSYDGTWGATAANTSWNGVWEVLGTRARAMWTGGRDDPLRGIVSLERYGERPQRVRLPRLPAVDRLGVLHELRRAIPTGDEPETSARDNLRSLATVLALGRSCDERRPVTVEEMLTR
jgi:predicted dehydrogenase